MARPPHRPLTEATNEAPLRFPRYTCGPLPHAEVALFHTCHFGCSVGKGAATTRTARGGDKRSPQRLQRYTCGPSPHAELALYHACHFGCSVGRGAASTRAVRGGDKRSPQRFPRYTCGPSPYASMQSFIDQFAGGGLPGLLVSFAPRPPEGEMDPRKQKSRTATSRDARGGRREESPPIYTQTRIARTSWGALSSFREVLKSCRLLKHDTDTTRYAAPCWISYHAAPDFLSQFIPHGVQTPTYPKPTKYNVIQPSHPNITHLTCFDFLSQFLPHGV